MPIIILENIIVGNSYIKKKVLWTSSKHFYRIHPAPSDYWLLLVQSALKYHWATDFNDNVSPIDR